jgi:DNA polymerase III subunit alpha
MMFATLDDLEGTVEMLVFNSAYAANADKIGDDKVLIVRGRVDHKDQGETKLVVQEVEVFEPTPEEVEEAREQEANAPPPMPKRVTLSVPGDLPETFLDELKDVVHHFPGDHELALRVGERLLVLGPDYRVSACARFHADIRDRVGLEPLAS